MNSILAMVAKLSGFSSVIGKLNGVKTYIAGSILLLQGLLGLLQSIIGINDLHALIDFARSLSDNADLGKIAGGLMAFGLRHAISKAIPPSV